MFLILIPIVLFLLAWVPFDHGPAGIIILVVFFVGFIGGLLIVDRSDRRFSEQIGFVCPFCRKSLYKQSSRGYTTPLITRGECPSCKCKLF